MKVLGPTPSFTLKAGMKLAPMMQELYDAIYQSGMPLSEVGVKAGVDPVTLPVWFSKGKVARLGCYEAVASTLGKKVQLVEEAA